MDGELSKPVRDFVIKIHQYIHEYAKQGKGENKRHKGLGFGHAVNVLESLDTRESFIRGLKKAAADLTEEEKLNAFHSAVATCKRTFWDDLNQVNVPDWISEAEVVELALEAVAIVEGREELVLPVDERFLPALREAQHRPHEPAARYYGAKGQLDAWVYC